MNIEKNKIGIFILRGDMFRGTKQNQILGYNSIIEYVIKPSKLNKSNIYIYVVTYYHKDNNIVYNIFKDYNVKLIIHEKKDQIYNYINSFNSIEIELIDKTDFILILRNDLYFLDKIDYKNYDENKILFQWNLFLSFKEKYIADQIQFIGKNLIKKFIKLINTKNIDIPNLIIKSKLRGNIICIGTLHNLYNFCNENFEYRELGYLNYIENPNPLDNECLIRGNPIHDLGNPLFNYIRFM